MAYDFARLESPREGLSGIEVVRAITFATIVSMIRFIPFAFRSRGRSIWKVVLLTNRLMLLGGVLSTLMLTLSIMYIPFLRDLFELTAMGLDVFTGCSTCHIGSRGDNESK